MQTARNVVPGRVKASKEKKKKTRKERKTKVNRKEGDVRRNKERTIGRHRENGGKIEKRVRMDAPHIISTMLLESSPLRLGDHP